jgi:urease accessory protein UreF
MKAANYHVIVQMEGPVLPMGVFAQMGGLEWIVLFHKKKQEATSLDFWKTTGEGIPEKSTFCLKLCL